jgi:hypothetical protein
MKHNHDATGHAALAICESLLLSLAETDVIDGAEARAILTDAASAHRNAMPAATNPDIHGAAADIIELMLKRGNSVHGT